MADDSAGNAVVELSADDTMTFVGVSSTALDSSNFYLYA